MEVPFNIITQGIGGIIDYLNPLSDNFILKKVIEPLINLVNYFNPDFEDFIGKKIIELIGELFQYLFVPENDHFGELQDIFNEKFGFIEQVKELVTHLFSFNYTQTASAEGSSSEEFIDITGNYPGFKITYYGYTFSIIDFSVLDKFRGYLHAIIVAVLWISFLLRLFKRLPGIIHGFDTTDAK